MVILGTLAPLSVVPAKAMVASGPLLFLCIYSCPDLSMVKNGRCGEEEPGLDCIVSVAYHPLEKQTNEPNPFFSKAPVVICGGVEFPDRGWKSCYN